MKRIAKCECVGTVKRIEIRATNTGMKVLYCWTDFTAQIQVGIPRLVFGQIAVQLRPIESRPRYPSLVYDWDDAARMRYWLLGKDIRIRYEVHQVNNRIYYRAEMLGMKEGTDYDYSPVELNSQIGSDRVQGFPRESQRTE